MQRAVINGTNVRYQEMSHPTDGNWVRLWIKFGYCTETMVDIDNLDQLESVVAEKVKAHHKLHSVRDLPNEMEDQ